MPALPWSVRELPDAGQKECSCTLVSFERLRKELELLPVHPKTAFSQVLSGRRCPDPLRQGALQNLTQRTHEGAGCVAGRLAQSIMCSQASLVQGNFPFVLWHLWLAVSLVPFTGPCLNAGKWPVTAAELYDNFHHVASVLGDVIQPREDERKGFFDKPLQKDEWSRRLGEKSSELVEELAWRSKSQPDSRSKEFDMHPMYSAAAPPDSQPTNPDEDRPCGLAAPSMEKRLTRKSTHGHASTSRPLSRSGCVWLLENACIEDRQVVLFARNGDPEKKLRRKLMGCGEFGNFDFNSVEVRPLAAWRDYPRNTTEQTVVDTLLVVPGMMSGVSAHNLFHVLHLTAPIAWQLHHPSYGLCVPREALDVRLAFLSAWHGRRQAHFWRIFTNSKRPSAANSNQRFHISATWRFWWGPLADHPPLPLGVDDSPRCYRRIIFGRELFRTARGGFVTPRVMSFYHSYLKAVSDVSGITARRLQVQLTDKSSDEPEWITFRHMQSGIPRYGADPSALDELKKHKARFFERGQELLSQPPHRMWIAEERPDFDPNAYKVDENPDPNLLVPVPTQLFHSPPASREIGIVPRWINVLIVQRPKGAGRWVANLDEALQWASAWRHPRVRLALLVVDMEKLHPATQCELSRSAHILMGVTGAALTWTAFLPKNGIVLDIFPPGSNFCTEGWNINPVSHYGGLARLAGIQHACMIHPAALQGSALPGESMGQQARREVRELLGGFWHGQNVLLDLDKFKQFFSEAVERVLRTEA